MRRRWATLGERWLTALAMAWVMPGVATAGWTTVQPLDFGVVPVDTIHTIEPLNAAYAGMWIFQPDTPYCLTGNARIRFRTLPLTLNSGANSVPVAYGATSARVWSQADPNSFVEFNPNGGQAFFPASWFPVVLALGGTVTVPPAQPLGTYTGNNQPRVRYRRSGNCRWLGWVSGAGTMSLIVQLGMTVTAVNGPINLGQIFAGTSKVVPADDGGGEAARYSVQGPPGLDWQLTVSTVDLVHGVQPDTVPLTFNGGLYGTVAPPTTGFVSGDIVPKTAHGGGPLHVWLGYRIDPAVGIAEGTYTGSLTLTVEGILN